MKLNFDSIYFAVFINTRHTFNECLKWFDSMSSDLPFIFPAKNTFRLLTHYARGNRAILVSPLKDSG